VSAFSSSQFGKLLSNIQQNLCANPKSGERLEKDRLFLILCLLLLPVIRCRDLQILHQFLKNGGSASFPNIYAASCSLTLRDFLGTFLSTHKGFLAIPIPLMTGEKK
jgi:hypothetical protein